MGCGRWADAVERSSESGCVRGGQGFVMGIKGSRRNFLGGRSGRNRGPEQIQKQWRSK